MAKIQKKPSNSNTTPETLSKSSHWSDLMHPEAFRLFPDKDAWRKRLIHTMYCWVDDKDEKNRPVLEIMQFCNAYKISWHTLKDWYHKYDDIKQAYDEIMLKLGSRRRVGAMHKEYSESAVFKDIHLYDPEWGPKVNEYWSKLKKDDADSKGTIIVHIPPVEITGKIKPKKEKKDA